MGPKMAPLSPVLTARIYRTKIAPLHSEWWSGFGKNLTEAAHFVILLKTVPPQTCDGFVDISKPYSIENA